MVQPHSRRQELLLFSARHETSVGAQADRTRGRRHAESVGRDLQTTTTFNQRNRLTILGIYARKKWCALLATF
jgi:hypothetical protein